VGHADRAVPAAHGDAGGMELSSREASGVEKLSAISFQTESY
jgi:hypothetical protein